MNVNKLEIHVAHACNLTCESCSHFSNNGHKGILQPEDIDHQMGLWSQRLSPKWFDVLGGEPLLNPKICEILAITRKHWKCIIELVTNGLLLPKFPNIGSAIQKFDIKLIISKHDDSEEYKGKLDKVFKFLCENNIPYFTRESYTNWTRRYKGWGENIKPYNDKNASMSWWICACKFCPQIFNGNIYKCPTIAYLQLQKKRWPNMSPKWDRYLEYKPLEPTATDDEINEFFSRREEFICEMCPAKTEVFRKESPLITLGTLISRTS